MSDIERQAVTLLVSGENGYQVLEFLRVRYRTPKSLSSKVSIIKKKALQRIRKTHDQMSQFSEHAEIKTFLDCTVYEQIQMLKNNSSSWPDEALKIGKTLQLLPPNFATFCLTKEESLRCKEQSDAAQLNKNDNVIIVKNASNILSNVQFNLENCERISLSLLACCLMIASGRRLAEIMNGKSVFVEVSTTFVQFDGQLKKRGFVKPYTIPLLIESKLFIRAFETLRDKQLRNCPNFNTLTNSQITEKYQGNLSRQLKISFKQFHHIHVFRSFYISAVYQMYQLNVTFARCAMLCLGHDDLKESLSYNNVKLENFERHALILGYWDIAPGHATK